MKLNESRTSSKNVLSNDETRIPDEFLKAFKNKTWIQFTHQTTRKKISSMQGNSLNVDKEF